MFKNLKRQITEETGAPPQPLTHRALDKERVQTDRRPSGTSGYKTPKASGFPASSRESRRDSASSGVSQRSNSSQPNQRTQQPISTKSLVDQSFTKITTTSIMPSQEIESRSTVMTSSHSHGRAEISDLKGRYESLQKAYEDYRSKTSELLSKKDSHISRLQERVGNLEEKITSFQSENKLHSIAAERDLLKGKANDLETAYATEKAEWEAKLKQQELTIAQLKTGSNSALADASAAFEKEKKNFEKQIQALTEENTTLHGLMEDKNSAQTLLLTELDETKNKLGTMMEENALLKTRVEEFLLKIDHEQKDVALQNEELRVALDQQQDYFETQDIESEQHITTLANQVDDLHTALDDQCRDLNTMNTQLLEREQEVEGYLSKINSLELNISRQQSVIETLREDLDRVKAENKSSTKERDDLLLRNASLSHEIEIEKRQSGNQLEEIQIQLKEVGRELEICRMKIRQQEDDIDAATRIENLEEKQVLLEKAVKERDTTIRLQQQRLNDLKKTLQKELKISGSNMSINTETPVGTPDGSENNLQRANHIMMTSNPNLSFPAGEVDMESNSGFGVNFQYMKHVVLRFVTASDYEASQLVRVISTLLKLSKSEEQLIWDTLQWKKSWVPGSKPQLRLSPRP